MLGCNMSIKVHFLHSHPDYFPESLGAVSEEQKLPFTSRYKINGVKISRSMECQHDGLQANYCWMLKI